MIKELKEVTTLGFGKDESVCVLGAGPSIGLYDREHFAKEFDYVIGANWIYRRFTVNFNVVTHFLPTMEIDQANDLGMTQLVYSRYTSDVQYQKKNFPAQGIVFDPYIDLWCGISTIIPALHLATKINPKQIYLAGVDLALKDGEMYVDGYTQNERKKPSDAHFKDWARVVDMQIKGLSKLTRCNFLTYGQK